MDDLDTPEYDFTPESFRDADENGRRRRLDTALHPEERTPYRDDEIAAAARRAVGV